jgi:DNA repair/transcription protein MET18/MMS19
MTKQLQPVRFKAYSLVDSMMKKQRKGTCIMMVLMPGLKKLGKSFIEGFVSLMALEKDPHNLMLCFSVLKVILVEFDIVGLQEVGFLLQFNAETL